MIVPGRSALSCLLLAVAQVSAEFTNLPDVPPGVFNVSARLEIATTKQAIWDALTDFPNYAVWNPFVRYAKVTNSFLIPLPDNEQYPQENKRLIMRVQIPPLPLPVSASTPDNPLHTQFTTENITAVQFEQGRLAWKYLADQILESERWQAVTDLGNGRVLYESREVYDGPGASLVQSLYGSGLQEGFEAQAQGLKLLLETP